MCQELGQKQRREASPRGAHRREEPPSKVTAALMTNIPVATPEHGPDRQGGQRSLPGRGAGGLGLEGRTGLLCEEHRARRTEENTVCEPRRRKRQHRIRGPSQPRPGEVVYLAAQAQGAQLGGSGTVPARLRLEVTRQTRLRLPSCCIDCSG